MDVGEVTWWGPRPCPPILELTTVLRAWSAPANNTSGGSRTPIPFLSVGHAFRLRLIQMLSICLHTSKMIITARMKATTYSSLSVRCPGRVVLLLAPPTVKAIDILRGQVICAASPSGDQGSTLPAQCRDPALGTSLSRSGNSFPPQGQGPHLSLSVSPKDASTATSQWTVRKRKSN